MSLIEIIEEIFTSAFIKILKEKGISTQEKIKIKIERAREEKLGDYACTSAMDKKIREIINIKNPKELANLWVEKIKTMKIPEDINLPEEIIHFFKFKEKMDISDFFEKIDIAGSGFINVFINKNLLFYFIFQAIQNPDNFGNSIKEKPEKVIFEFVSANPTGPLNIVSARAAALGDSCCNLLEASGDEVFREYYVNDYGNQVELLGISILLRILEKKGIKIKFSKKKDNENIYEIEKGIPFPSEGYHGDYIINLAEQILKENQIYLLPKHINRLQEISENTNLTDKDMDSILNEDLKSITEKLSNYAINYFIKLHQEDLKKFRVKFDNFFFESHLHHSGKVKEMISNLKPYIYEKDNKIFFRSTEFGDDQDRVIIRINGQPTYLLADIAYHFHKIQRNFTKIINIWGPDHHGYIARLKGAMLALGFPKDKFNILIAQQVSLKEKGKPIQMSKRAGKIIQMKELLEEVPIDVARYFFVMRSFESPLDFDLSEARDTSEKNPYYYVAYAHARIQSIFWKLKEENHYEFCLNNFQNKEIFKEILLRFKAEDFSCENLNSEENNFRRNLLFSIARFPEIIQISAKNYEPHQMTEYLYGLATEFSKFYTHKDNKILKIYKENQSEFEVLILLLFVLKICIKRGLNLLGMNAPEQL